MLPSPQEMMQSALEISILNRSEDLPIAAIIFDSSGSILSLARNAVIESGNATAHAEILAIGNVDAQILKRDGKDMCIAVTLEPCPMCAWAIRSAGIGKVVFGAYNPKYGAAGSVYDLLRDGRHGLGVEVVPGVLERECQQLLVGSFADIRNNRPR